MKPGYRRAAVGVVGCLLVGGALGSTPLKGGALAATAREIPPTVSQASLFWEPAFNGNLVPVNHASAHILSTRFLRPAFSPEPFPALETYVIRQGDTLDAIAQAYDTDTATLHALNEDVDEDALQIGHELRVVRAFHGLTYLVKEGDTLDGIASVYDVAADDIRMANGLQLDVGLREGELLFLPGARPRSRMVVSRSSSGRPEPRPAVVEPEPVVEAEPEPDPDPAPEPAPARKALSATGGGWVWPIVGGIESSEFGWRSDIGDFHEGLDLAVPAGTPGAAAKGGVVIQSGWDGGYGLCIIIDHGDGTRSRYAHASALLVNVGETVEQGQPILLVGSTGHSTGNHLHFEIIVDGQPQNPRNYLP